jgi:hypothetical protein
MESTRKMALVPQQLLSTLMAQQQMNPAIAQLGKIDASMQNVLENSNLPPDLKHIQYNQMMHNYQTMKDQELNKPITIDIKKSTSHPLTIPEDDIIGGMPKSYKNKAKILLSHIKRCPNFRVDEKGQVLVNDNVISDSNIMDLIHDYAKPNRPRKPPARGWREFGRALKQTNVPREAIVNISRWSDIDRPALVIQEQLPSTSTYNQRSDDDDSDDDQYATPIKASPVVLRRSKREKIPPKPYSPYGGWRTYSQKK